MELYYFRTVKKKPKTKKKQSKVTVPKDMSTEEFITRMLNVNKTELDEVLPKKKKP